MECNSNGIFAFAFFGNGATERTDGSDTEELTLAKNPKATTKPKRIGEADAGGGVRVRGRVAGFLRREPYFPAWRGH